MKFVKILSRVLILIVAWCLLTGATYPLSKTQWAENARQKVIEFRAKRRQQMLAEQKAQVPNAQQNADSSTADVSATQEKPQNEATSDGAVQGTQGHPEETAQSGETRGRGYLGRDASRSDAARGRGRHGEDANQSDATRGRGARERNRERHGSSNPEAGRDASSHDGGHAQGTASRPEGAMAPSESRGFHGSNGPGRGHGPSFGVNSWHQLGAFLLHVFVPCFLLAAVLAIGKRLRRKAT